MDKDVDAIMQTISEKYRTRWCGGENGPCACMGCVQVCNRIIMVETMTGRKYRGDPEYINELKIPKEIYDKFKITKSEWEAWMKMRKEV